MVDLRWGRLTMELPARPQQGQGPDRVMSHYRPILTVAQRFSGKRSSIDPIFWEKAPERQVIAYALRVLCGPGFAFAEHIQEAIWTSRSGEGLFRSRANRCRRRVLFPGWKTRILVRPRRALRPRGQDISPSMTPNIRIFPPATIGARARDLDMDVRAIAAWNAAAVAPQPVPPQPVPPQV